MATEQTTAILAEAHGILEEVGESSDPNILLIAKLTEALESATKGTEWEYGFARLNGMPGKTTSQDDAEWMAANLEPEGAWVAMRRQSAGAWEPMKKA